MAEELCIQFRVRHQQEFDHLLLKWENENRGQGPIIWVRPRIGANDGVRVTAAGVSAAFADYLTAQGFEFERC